MSEESRPLCRPGSCGGPEVPASRGAAQILDTRCASDPMIFCFGHDDRIKDYHPDRRFRRKRAKLDYDAKWRMEASAIESADESLSSHNQCAFGCLDTVGEFSLDSESVPRAVASVALAKDLSRKSRSLPLALLIRQQYLSGAFATFQTAPLHRRHTINRVVPFRLSQQNAGNSLIQRRVEGRNSLSASKNLQ
jgi:hypothetical protein